MIEIEVETKYDIIGEAMRVWHDLAKRGAPIEPINGCIFPTVVRSGRIVIEPDFFGQVVVRWEA